MTTRSIAVVLSVLLGSSAWAGKVDKGSCSAKGKKLAGKVKVVTSFPDLKVKLVKHFPDLKVKKVKNFANACGEWQFVDTFPDFTVQFVEAFPDVEVQYVEAFPGVR